MVSVVFAALFLLLAVLGPVAVGRLFPESPRRTSLARAVRWVSALIAAYLVGSTSYVNIGKDEVGLVTKVFGGKSMTPGRIIATEGEQGPQARVIPPGFHPEPLINVLNTVERVTQIEIPDGKYGYLVATDGAPLRPNQTFADALDGFAWKDGERAGKPIPANDMLDAETFLRNGGQKGPQTTILTPGTYRLNTFLWKVAIEDATDIPTGKVGVVKSNVHSSVSIGNLVTAKPASCEPTSKRSLDGGELAVPLVPVGCVGVWDNSITPGKAYVNKRAYSVEVVDTRVQTWEYRGGYRKRYIDLQVAQDGSITQNARSEDLGVPPGAADSAVSVKVEGWDVPQELRVLVQVTPTLAPFVVASVGGVKEVEDRIITPLVRSVVRNVAGGVIKAPVVCADEDRKDADGNVVHKAACERGEPFKDAQGKVIEKERPTRVLDLIENRPLLERNIEAILKVEGAKAGVDIKEVRLGDPAIPPELLVSRLREQLADQLTKAYKQEKLAQDERVKTENARATASKQGDLVGSVINVQKAEQDKVAAKLRGEGEQLALQAIAAGQKAQAQVLGEDRVADLRKYEMLLGRVFDFADKHPDVLTSALTNASKFVPNTVVSGEHGLSGAAAILGQFLGKDAEAPAQAAPAKR